MAKLSSFAEHSNANSKISLCTLLRQRKRTRAGVIAEYIVSTTLLLLILIHTVLKWLQLVLHWYNLDACTSWTDALGQQQLVQLLCIDGVGETAFRLFQLVIHLGVQLVCHTD